jgi:hypothetical protein
MLNFSEIYLDQIIYYNILYIVNIHIVWSYNMTKIDHGHKVCKQ